MQMNYESLSLSRRTILLPATQKAARPSRGRQGRDREHSTSSVFQAHHQASQSQVWENVVWITVALGALATLVVSFAF